MGLFILVSIFHEKRWQFEELTGRPGWQHVLPNLPSACSLDNMESASTKRVLEGRSSNVTVPARSSASMLHKSLPVACNLVAPFCGSDTQLHRLGGIYRLECNESISCSLARSTDCSLQIGNSAITILSPGIEVIDGLFQAIAVRSGGFYVVSITSTRISLQVLYVLMMFISAYPVVITMRNSNVYEERSLGIFAEDRTDAKEQHDGSSSQTLAESTGTLGSLVTRAFGGVTMPSPKGAARKYFISQQLRAQLAHDAWWIALAVFVIMIIEGGQFETNPTVFSVFNVIFEVVSGYGCVGISTGVPWAAYSFCGSWHALSKLVLVAVMLRGRHRGLPVAIDHAVQLPGAQLTETEEEDGRMRMASHLNRDMGSF